MRTFERRALALVAATGLAFTIVGTRLYYLQVVHGKYYTKLMHQDYQRILPIAAPRGNIVTANGVTIATSKPSWTLYDLSPETPLPNTELTQIAALLDVPVASLTAQIASEKPKLAAYDPIPLDSNLTAEQITRIDVNQESLPNVKVQAVAEREYPYGSVMGNIIGYISQTTPGTTVGSAGLEAEYQHYLTGSAGGEVAEVNSVGNLIKIVGKASAKPGDTVHLTINWTLEETATRALAYVIKEMHKPGDIGYSPGAESGGVIAIDPNNGHILAMASYPSYNPQELIPSDPTERDSYFTALAKNPNDPFSVIPIQALIAPASTFKPLMAVAALAHKTITPTSEIYDPGYFPLIPSFHSWEYPDAFGWLNLEQAIGLSDDTFFYTLGYRMGIHVIDDWLKRFMVNQLTGIDLPGEVKSRLPTPALLEKEENTPWTVGWTLNTVIGQGISQYTMIALVRAYSAIANGGTLYQPQLVSSITSPSGRVVKAFSPVVQGKINLPASVWESVHKGMELSAQDPDIAHTGTSGTGYPTLEGFPLPLASKTGTGQKTDSYNNAFFLTEGPMPHPSILIYTYIDNGTWGAYSGYVARAIYDQYFKVKDPAALGAFDYVFGNAPWPFGYTGSK